MNIHISRIYYLIPWTVESSTPISARLLSIIPHYLNYRPTAFIVHVLLHCLEKIFHNFLFQLIDHGAEVQGIVSSIIYNFVTWVTYVVVHEDVQDALKKNELKSQI